jgi:uncharacterized membrane protein YkoI
MSTTKIRRASGAAALLAAGLVAGGVLAGTLTAGAAETASPSASSSSATAGNPAETPLTGSKLSEVKAAVLAKYPGATFDRVETDSDGVYEAHITKADGSSVTVELDKSFAVTGEE